MPIRSRRPWRRGRRLLAGILSPVLATGSSVVPVVFTASAAAALTVVGAAAGAAPAKAATGSVLILSTSVTGGTGSAEAAAVPSGYTVTVASSATWDAMTPAQFAAYSAIIIGDPSGTSCATSVPSDALSTAATWGAAVTGNVAVAGTAPAFAGTAGSALLKDAIGYAVAGSGTGLYVSLNCDYASSSGSPVPLLAHVDGGGFAVTGQGSACPDTGRVNTWEAEALAPFNGLANSTWSSPACSVEETFTAWPAALSGVGYLNGASPADFTASDGQTGQPFLLAGAPPSSGTQALAPSAGGEVPAGATAGGGSNPAAPGVDQATAGDPVNTENGDFTQSDTDESIATFGPPLDFTRTYDAQLAQQQTVAGTPGPMGYGWTDNWATSLAQGRPVPGDVYLLDGLAANIGDGGPAGSATLDSPGGVFVNSTGTYIADAAGNRVQEVPAVSGTQWGIPMVVGDMYTIAGSAAGTAGLSGDGGAATSALLRSPEGVTVDGSGNLYIADTGNNRVQEVSPAGTISTFAGSATGASGTSGDQGPATSALLDQPADVTMGAGATGDLYIADTGNNEIQEVAASAKTQWGWTMTAGDIYTIAGRFTGDAGSSGDGGTAAQAYLDQPQGVVISSAGDIYIADTLNNRVQEVPAADSTQWGQSMTKHFMYTVTGTAGSSGTSGDGGAAGSALLTGPAGVAWGSSGQLYIADTGNSRVQEAAVTSHTERGTAMTAGDIYTIAGSASGTSGYSGNGGAATSALLSHPAAVATDASGSLIVADTANFRVRRVSASSGNIAAFAGDGSTAADSGDGGPATQAALNQPAATAADGAGDLYIADMDNNRVQEIAASDHTQWGISMTGGDVYTIAGSPTGKAGTSGTGGPATSALLTAPNALAVDASGDVYIASDDGTGSGSVVQEIAATGHTQWGTAMTAGDIYIVAGGGSSTSLGVSATSAGLAPDGLAADPAGDLYISDVIEDRVDEVPAASGSQWGQSMTVGDIYDVAGSTAGTAGYSGNGGPGTSALLDFPQGLALDAAGSLYIADSDNSRIQELAAVTGPHWGQSMTAGDIYTVAGVATGTGGYSGDGGPATAALLSSAVSQNGPSGVAVDAVGDLYIADTSNSAIREVAAASGTQWAQSMTAGDIYTVAGGQGVGHIGDGGPATAARLKLPWHVSVDLTGDLFISDQVNNRIREVAATTSGAFPQYPTPPGITITQDDGSQVTFYPQVSGSCTAPYVQARTGSSYCTLPQDISATLAYNSGTAAWTYSPDPGATYTYNSAGSLISEADAAGDALTITYNSPAPGTGRCPATASACQTITAANGRTLVAGTSASGLITSVTDPASREWTYAYSGGDLTSATDPRSKTTSYTYGQGSTGNPQLANDLLTITTPNAQPGGPDAGDDTVNVYNAVGQVTSQTDPMGYQTTFSYCTSAAAGNCLNTATGTGTVTVTDPDGNITVDDYQQGTLAAQASYTGSVSSADLTSEQDTIPDTTAGGTSGGTLLATTTADGDGHITTATYDSAGNQTSATAPDGVGSQTATTTDWSTALGDTSCTSDAQASGSCTSTATGPASVVPGGTITPPATAPPAGVTWTLYDTDGNQLYTITGVYQPGASTASYSQTTYQLYVGDSVTLPGTSTAVTCTATPPSASLPCATINADGVVTQLAYDTAGDLTSAATPDGNGTQIAATTYSYNNDGQQTSVTAPDGNLTGANAGNYTTTTAYNGDGLKTTVTQAGGAGATATPRTTTYSYDADSNQTTVQDARGYTTTTTYNADDQATLVTDPDDNATLTCYDGDANTTQTVPPAGVAASLLTASSCPSAYPSGYSDRLASDATAYTYDASSDQTVTTTPAPAGHTGHETTTTTYDGNGQPLTTTAPPTSNTADAPSQVTTDTYNTVGELTTQTTGTGTSAASTVSYCYDPDGDKTAMVYADGNNSAVAPCNTNSSHPYVVDSTDYPTQASYQTTYGYDSAGDLVSSTTPATAATGPSGGTTTATFDPEGNMLTSTDPNGVTTTRTYTPANLVASVAYSGSSAHSVTNTYDANGQKTAMTDATGSSSYAYDPFEELISSQNGAGKTVTYSYDTDGNGTGIAYPLGSSTWASSSTVAYGYSHADVLTSITDFNNHQTTITPNADSLPASITLGATGDSIINTFDPTGEPSAIALKNGSSTLQSFNYVDAPAGNTISETDAPASPQSPAVYAYDAAGRVTSLTPGSGSPQPYAFDASSNMTTLPTGAAASYDHSGELISSTLAGASTDYNYDADGQRLTSKQGASTATSGTWNGAGQLIAYTSTAATMTAATYDGDGLRATDSSGASLKFTWNTSADWQMPVLLTDSTNAYIYGTGQAPIEQVNLSTGTVTDLVADSLGSVRDTVNSAGSLTGATNYDPWGNPETSGGLTATTPFGYAGGYTDPTGMIYLVHRYYDPATGQFTSVDADVSQTVQPYEYAAGNPISNIDPTGCHCIEHTYYDVRMLSRSIHFNSGMEFTNGPGTGSSKDVVTATKSRTRQISASITGSVEFSESAIIESAKVSLSVTVAASVSGTETYSAQHGLKKGYYGHLQWVVWGYKVAWKKRRITYGCTAKTLGQGTARLPNPNNQGYRFWNSKAANG